MTYTSTRTKRNILTYRERKCKIIRVSNNLWTTVVRAQAEFATETPKYKTELFYINIFPI